MVDGRKVKSFKVKIQKHVVSAVEPFKTVVVFLLTFDLFLFHTYPSIIPVLEVPICNIRMISTICIFASLWLLENGLVEDSGGLLAVP